MASRTPNLADLKEIRDILGFARDHPRNLLTEVFAHAPVQRAAMSRNTFGLLLAIVIAAIAATPPGRGPGPKQAVVGMDEVPSNAKIQDLLRRTDSRRRNQDPRLYDLLFRYLRDDDARDLRRCRARIDRRRYDHLAGDRLWPRRCQN